MTVTPDFVQLYNPVIASAGGDLEWKLKIANEHVRIETEKRKCLEGELRKLRDEHAKVQEMLKAAQIKLRKLSTEPSAVPTVGRNRARSAKSSFSRLMLLCHPLPKTEPELLSDAQLIEAGF